MRSLGTTPLCAWCHWEFVSGILARRPDLHAPAQGEGHPIEWPSEGPPLLRCTRCKATWHGKPREACGWCEERAVLDVEVQRSIDASRLQEYLAEIAEGDQGAIVACSRFLKVAIQRGTLPQRALQMLRDAIGEAA